MANRTEDDPGLNVPFPPMPPAWREPEPGVAVPPLLGPAHPQSPAQPFVGAPRPPTIARPVRQQVTPYPPQLRPPMPPPQTGRPLPPPAGGPRSAPPVARPLSPIPYPGLPMSAPPHADPLSGAAGSSRSAGTAGLLQIFLGMFGAGRFYTGHVGTAIAQLLTVWGVAALGICGGAAFFLPFLFMSVGLLWPLLDGVNLLFNGGTDSDGRRLRS